MATGEAAPREPAARTVAPREVALRILDGLFGSRSSPAGVADIGLEACSLVAFQAEGVARVRAILDRRGGAILADSVGLGKTYMAVALLEETLRGSGDAVVVVPAATRRLWRRALRRLPDAGGGWRLLSHTQLARGAPVRAAAAAALTSRTRANQRLVVVDEAHRFRNPGTLRYAALARLVAPGTRVLFLTATPVNNRAEDLLHLVRLFADDDAFRDVGVSSLRDAFVTGSGAGAGAGARGGEGAGRGESARRAAVVRATVVRRTRAMVRARFGGSMGVPPAAARGEGPPDRAGPRFPHRAPPRLIRYVDPSLPRLVGELADLELAPYTLRGPESTGAAGSAALIRIGLLKRLDSSPAAFQASLHRLAQILRATLDAARAGRILAAPGRSGQGPADSDPLQLTLVELVARPAPPDLDLDRLARSVESDLTRVRRMGRLRGLHDRGPNGPAPGPSPGRLAVDAVALDSKLLALHGLLTTMASEKTLVFTEYRDTADALWRGLRDHYRVGRVDGSGAWLGRRRAGRRAVVERFAPVANGRRPPPDRERVDVLIATDVLAEGLNLQDARHVVSYELPWNPVRLLQRIGRVDRLGSPHAEVVPYLFAPHDGLEAMLGLTRRVRAKLGHIAATVGAEQADELLERLAEAARACTPLRETPADPGAAGGLKGAMATALERAESEPADPVEELRTLWIRNRRTHRRPGGAGGGGATGAAIAVPRGGDAARISWVVLVRCRGAPILLEIESDGNVAEAGEATLAVLALALDGAPGGDLRSAVPLGPIEGYLAEAAVQAHSPPRLSHHDPGLRLMRRLRRTMARAGAGLDPRVVARADALLDRIAVPLDPAGEARVRSVLDRDDDTSVTTLLDAAETALEGRGATRKSDPRDSRAITVVAALQIGVSDTPPRG